MFESHLALASLSGEADADWALAAADHAGAAFLGGIALDEPAREAARKLVARDREEFLPPDPLAFIDKQLASVADADATIRPGFNVRSTTAAPIREAAAICADYDAIIEINAHCRQDELCAVGCGESLLADTNRLAEYVAVAAETGAAVSVKVRVEVDGVDLVAVAEGIEAAGADAIHIDAMDAESVVGEIGRASCRERVFRAV